MLFLVRRPVVPPVRLPLLARALLPVQLQVLAPAPVPVPLPALAQGLIQAIGVLHYILFYYPTLSLLLHKTKGQALARDS
jgi:hypothetical protein